MGDAQAHDAVVVGGGVAGAVCALQLAAAGLDDVVILERDDPASKASGRAAGNITTYRKERFGPAAARFGREFYEDLAARHGVTLHRSRAYTIAYTDEGADTLRRKHDSLTMETELLAGAELAAAEPAIDGDGVTAALRFPEARYTDPAALTRAVHAEARDRGVDLVRATATGLVPGDRVAVETEADAHAAPTVVVAAGAWTDRLLASAGARVALTPRISQIAVLDPPAGRSLDVPVWSAPDYSVYGRATPEGRVLFGGGVSTSVDLDGFRPRARVPFLGEVAGRGASVIPALADASLRDDWAGRVSATPDLRPHVGATGVDGLYVCAGFNGEGISNAPFAGRLLADLVVGREPIVDPGPFDPARHDPETEFETGNAVEWAADR
jgi:sarcosine oxidase subunit beta